MPPLQIKDLDEPRGFCEYQCKQSVQLLRKLFQPPTFNIITYGPPTYL